MPEPKNSPHAITLHDVDLVWPDGSIALHQISGTFPTGRTGLVGDNGSGKSTLLRLIAGELAPTTGSVSSTGAVAVVPQCTPSAETTVADLLGVADQIAALARADAGNATVEDFAVIDDDWDLAQRLRLAMAEAGLGDIDLARTVGTLSGGERMMVALLGVRLQEAPITLLDEPSNNLDRAGREWLLDLVRSWSQTLLVASHDPELLEAMDSIAELHDGRISFHGGGFSAWRSQLEAEQEAARRGVRDAERELAKEKRQRIESQEILDRRRRTGARASAEKRLPKMVMGLRRSSAQVSAAKLRGEKNDSEQQAREQLSQAQGQIRDDDRIRVVLPDPGIHSTQRIAELHHGGGVHHLVGPERIALNGPNGVGKTTLLQTLEGSPRRGSAFGIALTDRIGQLGQRRDGLVEDLSAIDNLHRGAPSRTPQELRAELARFLLRGDVVDLPVSALSGGERFRVALAAVLLADPAPQLLILDEPTNDLDLTSVEQLVEALRGYAGALLVVSHDRAFLDRLGLDRELQLDREGWLHLLD